MDNFIELTTLKEGEEFILNLRHVVRFNRCSDGGSRVALDCEISNHDHHDYMYVRETYEWIKWKMTGKYTGDLPKRFDEETVQ